MNDDIAAARKLLISLRQSDEAQYNHWREDDEPPYETRCADRILGFTRLEAGLDALERERAVRERLECPCCGHKLWECCCHGAIESDGKVTTCWGTHGPSLAAKLAAEKGA